MEELDDSNMTAGVEELNKTHTDALLDENSITRKTFMKFFDRQPR